MTSLGNLSLRDIQRIIISEKEVWCVGHHNRVFKSKVSKVFGNLSSHINLSVWDEELSRDVEGNKHLNASQIVNIDEAFTTEEEAIELQELWE